MRKKLLCGLTCFVMLFSLALSGCGKTEITIGDAIYNEKTGEMYIDTLENKERIKISYATGCGLEWIKEAGASFLKLYHDKYYLVLDPDPVLASSLKTTLETGISKTMSDVYFTQNDVWQTWAVRGWMEPLTTFTLTRATEIPKRSKTGFARLLKR